VLDKEDNLAKGLCPIARRKRYVGATEQKKRFLTIVPNAEDDIREQMKVLEDLGRKK
jgi:hypothetical protein